LQVSQGGVTLLNKLYFIVFGIGLFSGLLGGVGCSDETVAPTSSPNETVSAPTDGPTAASTEEPSESPQESELLNPAVGSTARIGDLEITYHGFRIDEGNASLTPQPGRMWIAVDVTVKNVGSADYLFSTLSTTFNVRDAAGFPIGGVGQTSQSRSDLDGNIPPGESRRGERGMVIFVTVIAGSQLIVTDRSGEEARWNLE